MLTLLLTLFSRVHCAPHFSFSVPRSQVFTHTQSLAKGATLSLSFDIPNGVVFIGTKSGKSSTLTQSVIINNHIFSLTAPGFFVFGNDFGTLTITAKSKSTVWVTAAYVGAPPLLCSEVRPAVGDVTLTSAELTGDVCFFRTSPVPPDVTLYGSLGAGGQVQVRRGDEQKSVKVVALKETKEAKVDALIVKASGVNLRLRFSESKAVYRFDPVPQDHYFGIYGNGKVIVPKQTEVAKNEAETSGVTGFWKGGTGIWFLVDLLGLYVLLNFAWEVFEMLTKPQPKPGRIARWFQKAKIELAEKERKRTITANICALLFALIFPWFTIRLLGIVQVVELAVAVGIAAGLIAVVAQE